MKVLDQGKKIVENWKEHKFHQGMTVLFVLLFFAFWQSPSTLSITQPHGTFQMNEDPIRCTTTSGFLSSGLLCQTKVDENNRRENREPLKSPKYEITATAPSESETDANIKIEDIRDGDQIRQTSLNTGSRIALDNMIVEVETVGPNTVEGKIYSLNHPKMSLDLLTGVFLIAIIGSLILATYTEQLEARGEE